MKTRRGRGDDGFTLIELLVSIVILGVVMTGLAAVVISYLKDTNSTIGRLQESHDAQISAAFFTQDVESAGVRATATPFAPAVLDRQLRLRVLALPVRDRRHDAGDPVRVERLRRHGRGLRPDPGGLRPEHCAHRAAPVDLQEQRDGGERHRPGTRVGPGEPADNLLLASSCASYTTTLPATVSLTLTIKDQYHVGSTFAVTLTGHPRQAT